MATNYEENPTDFIEKEKVFYSIFDPLENASTIKEDLWITITGKFDAATRLGPVIFSSKLQKKSKALGYWVTRYYFLFENHLAYGSNKNFTKIKKYINLEGLKACLTRAETNVEKTGSNVMLAFFRCSKLFMLKASNEAVLGEWLTHLRSRCIMVNLSYFYLMLHMLGKGSYGKVYLIQDKVDSVKYAAKVISKEKIITRLLGLDTLFNEIKMLRKLDHPNIVKLKEVFETPSSIYLIIDYVEGDELKTRLLQKAHFTEKECVPLMKNILQTIAYLHEKKIVHRDLKLENILVPADSSSDIKLVDFGLSIDLNESQVAKKGGTFGYMAPEILNDENGKTIITTKGDIFSLGCIFYRLLTGKKLFNGNTAQEIFEKNRECYINLNGPLLANKLTNTKDLLAQMLEKDPHKRISAAEALEHPFFSPEKPGSFAEFAESPEDVNVAPVSQYSFDVNHMKENIILSASKVFDYNSSVVMQPHISQHLSASGITKSPRITFNVDFTHHTISCAGTGYIGESSIGSGLNPSGVNIDENKSAASINLSNTSPQPTLNSRFGLDSKSKVVSPQASPTFRLSLRNSLGNFLASPERSPQRLKSPSSKPKLSLKGFEDYLNVKVSVPTNNNRRKSNIEGLVGSRKKLGSIGENKDSDSSRCEGEIDCLEINPYQA